MNTPIRIFIVFFMFALVSCEEDFYLDRDNFRPTVTVNSIFKDGESWVVDLSFTKDILVEESLGGPITNAKVSVIEKFNNRETPLIHVGNGKYRSDIYPPEPDKTYELQVKVPGYDLVTATSRAPKKANVVNVITDVIEKNVIKVNFEINDNINNYYIWNFISTNKKNPIDSSFTGSAKSYVSGIIRYNQISKYLSEISNIGENDAEAQGGIFTSNVKEEVNNEETGPQEERKRFLRLVTASKDLYDYYKTVEKFTAAENHNSSFSYSPEIYSNIKNGIGIFAGYSEEFKEIK